MSKDSVVVVAYLDSGINPYHEVFQRPLDRDVVRGLGSDGREPLPLRLASQGNYSQRVQSDQGLWESLEAGTLYWFEGTNVLGISFEPEPPAGDSPRVLDGLFHGTQVASVLSQMDPQVVILSVQADIVGEDPRDTFPSIMAPWFAEAVRWMARQPWIDVVSLSLGGIGNLDDPSFDDFARATRELVAAGKVFVASASNWGTVHWTDTLHGPPWVIAVGGAENSTRGVVAVSAKNPDAVATFTNLVARHDSVDEYDWSSGTSYGSPLVAATVSRALGALRGERGWAVHDTSMGLAQTPRGVVTNADVREALNATAEYWNTTDFDPAAYPAPLGVFTTLYSANIPVGPTPWVEMGWGYVGPELAPVLARALEGGRLPAKPEAAVAYMAEVQAAREAYWDARLGA